ncbi:hypothetical protein NDU88_002650 [Pleurodeles waltl]|uniref:Uncharacterized protein n=1 Tax=Pleurodeles waltl TaxID=8319 RepID=A0AAV7UBT4_PLEWA|nr:hypothetical protein NDU88_002650 [Pleurodeles waltl]
MRCAACPRDSSGAPFLRALWRAAGQRAHLFMAGPAVISPLRRYAAPTASVRRLSSLEAGRAISGEGSGGLLLFPCYVRSGAAESSAAAIFFLLAAESLGIPQLVSGLNVEVSGPQVSF